MARYLGETPVDIALHPEFARYTAADWAMLFIARHGSTDGVHHKDWVLDQVARILRGTPVLVTQARWDDGQMEYRFATGEPSAAYQAWVDSCLGKTYPDGSREYGYNEGIAP